MNWQQLIMNLGALDPVRLEKALTDLGAVSVTLTDAADDPVLEPPPGETPLWRQTRVSALFGADADLSHAPGSLRTALDLEATPDVRVEILEDRAWEREWLKDFAPMKFGERLWVVPNGGDAPPDAIRIDLDPGLAFGTGTHPTTALCLDWLDGLSLDGKSVLDLGCGSGILGIAALKLGAASVRAVDIDLQALAATRQNADRNGVSARLETSSEPDTDERFDIVVANILAGTLVKESGHITASLQPGGKLCLSGILAGQAEDVMHAYRDTVSFSATRNREDWVLLVGTRH